MDTMVSVMDIAELPALPAQEMLSILSLDSTARLASGSVGPRPTKPWLGG